MLPYLDDAKNAYAEQRLLDGQEIWITTIRRDGQPQASPVGFLWNGADILILSQPNSQKVRNLSGNPKVALHFDIDRHADSNGVVTLEGLAIIDPNPLSADEAATYAEKYQDVLRDAELTPAELFADFSAAIRVKPTRSRAY